MRLLIIFILMMGYTLNMFAQFYTIASCKNSTTRVVTPGGLGKSVEVDDSSDRCEQESTSYLKDSNDIDSLIEEYLSVSFPLKQIKINSSFGMRLHPIDKIRKKHNGIDLQAQSDEIYAMLDGTVSKVGYDSASGNYITIRHAGNITVSYCHLEKSFVSVNEDVKAGHILGISGKTGKSTDFHLHLTYKKNGEYQDPIILLDYISQVRKTVIKKMTDA